MVFFYWKKVFGLILAQIITQDFSRLMNYEDQNVNKMIKFSWVDELDAPLRKNVKKV